MKTNLQEIDMHKLIKKAILVVVILIVLLSMVVGILTSDFNKIKKFDSSNKSPRAMISSMNKSSKNRYYNTEISIDSSNNMANLGDFTFNIGNEKMLIANISLKYKAYTDSNGWMNGNENIKKEILKKSAILRDAIIDTMIGSYDESSSEQRMKREIQRSVNKKISSGEIEEVYFNKFIFQ